MTGFPHKHHYKWPEGEVYTMHPLTPEQEAEARAKLLRFWAITKRKMEKEAGPVE